MAYLMSVDGEPPEAVAEAVRRFIRGEVARERSTFLPSTAELEIEVRACKEHAEIAARYAAMAPNLKFRPKPEQIERTVSPEERKRVKAMIDQSLATLWPKPKADEPNSPEASLDALAIDLSELQFSSALRNAMSNGTGLLKIDQTGAVRGVPHDEWRE